jgi:hypothetical protein
VQYLLSIDCDDRRRLVGIKIFEAGQPVPQEFTIVDIATGGYPFTVPNTAKIRIQFLWKVHDLSRSKLLEEDYGVGLPPATPTVMVGAPPMPPPVAAELQAYDGPEVRGLRPRMGELAIFVVAGDVTA